MKIFSKWITSAIRMNNLFLTDSSAQPFKWLEIFLNRCQTNPFKKHLINYKQMTNHGKRQANSFKPCKQVGIVYIFCMWIVYASLSKLHVYPARCDECVDRLQLKPGNWPLKNVQTARSNGCTLLLSPPNRTTVLQKQVWSIKLIKRV